MEKAIVSVALRALYHPEISQEDFEDMMQEASIALWRCEGRPQKYAFTAGVRACIKWFLLQKVGWKSGGPERAHRTIHSDMASLNEIADSLGEDKIMFVDAPSGERDPLSESQIMRLVEIFVEARHKRGERGLRAAVRDASIIALICGGYSNEGIAKELGISAKSVIRYRGQIRKVLSKFQSLEGGENVEDEFSASV